jgi:N-methylhydantoinase A
LTKYRLAIDIGETLTDVVALNERSQEILNIKVPSTPKRNSKNRHQSIPRKTNNTKISVIIHATTVTTDALLGQTNLEFS